MKGTQRRSAAPLALLLAAMLALSAWSGIAGYYIDANGNHIYISDSSVSDGRYYLNGVYYTAYTGSLNNSYLGSYTGSYYPYNYYWGVSPVTYSYTQATMDSLGGVTAPRTTLLEARANNHYLGLYVVGMREDLMDTEAIGFGVSATQLTFQQSLGRASDKSLALIMRSAASSVSDDDQFALGIYGTYHSFQKALDEKLESLTLIDRNENYRMTIELKSFVEALKQPLSDVGARLNKDGIQVQIRPVTAPEALAAHNPNATVYQISVFLYKYDDDMYSRVDLSSAITSLHAMVRANSATKSVLVSMDDEDQVENAASARWVQRATGEYFSTGYVPAGDVFTAVPVTK